MNRSRIATPLALLAGTLLIGLPGCSSAQGSPGNTPSPSVEGEAGPRSNGARSASEGTKPYDEVITSSAVTQEGLFKVHRIDEKLFFEIPTGELNKDMLLTGRVDEGAGLSGGFANGRIVDRIVRWERNGDEIQLRTSSFSDVADSTTAISRAVRAMARGPIVATFTIETFGPDSAAVIEVGSLYTGNIAEMAPLRGVQNDRSYVEWSAAFPNNIEIQATQTGVAPPNGAPGGTPPVTTSRRAHWSMLKLPENAMMPRLHDSRVGFLTTSTVDYSRMEPRAERRTFIRRFRLEKSNPSAEVSDPLEPIVFWMDPATPEWLVPWVKKGVEQWVEAYEGAGFSNAIMAREAPSADEDPNWSMHDARNSMIYWRPSAVSNATGGSVVDPRTGQIMKAEVNMYHNVLNLLRNWYFIQAGPLDVRAQDFPLPDSIMGAMVEYVVAHEVGHAIGFPHNFKASAMYPADSLRSRTFLERQGGHVATLMDYSRLNYVAQPEDNIPPELLIPKVGPYDRYAIMWGHKPIPGAMTPDEERATLNEWSRMQDTIPWFRFTTPGAPNDPHAVTEAVGNADAVKSSTLAMRNLERVMGMLLQVAEKPGEDYSTLEELYSNAIAQWGRYNSHVAALVGGAYTQERHGTGARWEPVSRPEQQEALRWLTENTFNTPAMFVNPDILRRIEAQGAIERIGARQGQVLSQLFSDVRMNRLIEYEATSNGVSAYTVADLLADLRSGVWTELNGSNVQVDVYRRHLQRQYLAAADRYLAPASPGTVTDARPILRSELQELSRAVATARARAGNAMTRLHLQDVESEIERILDPRANRVAATDVSSPFGLAFDEWPSPLPFDPEGWMEMMGITHPGGWQALMQQGGISESGHPVTAPVNLPEPGAFPDGYPEDRTW